MNFKIWKRNMAQRLTDWLSDRYELNIDHCECCDEPADWFDEEGTYLCKECRAELLLAETIS